MSGLVGDLWNWNAGLVERKANFKKIVNRMGRWPGYGGSAVAMGEWPAYGDLPRCMGRCVRRVAVWENRDTVWGNGLCGRPQNRMGSRENVWEMPRDMGNGAGTCGGRQAVWGARIALKPGIWERWRPADFACFYEFLAGGGGMAFATVRASHRACCECRGA